MASKSLVVRVIDAQQLLAADKGGTSDPYVKIRVGTVTQKTKTIKKCLNPKWEETFKFRVSNPSTAKLVVEVFDHDTFSKDDPLGSVSISLNTLEQGVELVKVYNLTGVPKGKIQIGLKAEDFGLPPGSAPKASTPAQTTSPGAPGGFQSNYPSAASNYPAQGGQPVGGAQQYPPAGQYPGGAGGYPQQGGYGPPGTYPPSDPYASQSQMPPGGAPSGYPGGAPGYPPADPYASQMPPGGAPGMYPPSDPYASQMPPGGGYPPQVNPYASQAPPPGNPYASQAPPAGNPYASSQYPPAPQ